MSTFLPPELKNRASLLVANADSPLLSHIGVTALVPDIWGGPWESRHQLLTRLARYVQVVWVDPVDWWSPAWRRRRRPPRLITHTQSLPPGFRVFSSSYLFPTFSRRPFGYASEYLRLRAARLLMELRGARQHVLYLWRDHFHTALERGRYDISCYHIDDDYSFSTQETPLSVAERAMISGVDAVFIASPGLMERKGHLNPTTHQVTNGVDFAHFATLQPEPADLQSIPRPRIGYVGIIKKQLDVDVLLSVARRSAELSFVLVGPKRKLHDDAEKWQALSNLPNVYMLGEKHFRELASYVQHLDVCLLCYRKNAYTNQIYPLKLHEYLAAGKPVVGTPLRSFEEFRDVIRLAETAEEWTQQINQALAEDSPALAEARRAIARRYDWEVLAVKVAELICHKLGPRHEEALAAALAERQRPD